MKRNEYSLTMNWCNVSIAIVFFVIIALLILYVPQTKNVDSSILYSIHAVLSAYPSSIPKFISEFGYAQWYLWPQITAVCVLASHRKYVPAVLFVLTMQIAGKLLVLLKDFICRARPAECLRDGYSFPSGHSVGIMCFCGLLIFLINRYVKTSSWRYFLTGLFGLWILLVGISRMWLLAHYPTDVLAGYLLGIMFVNLYAIIVKWFNV